MKVVSNKQSHPAEALAACSILAHRLGPLLKAVYLHGSAVGEGLRVRSDVDVLAIITGPLSPLVRKHLLTGFMAASGHYPFDHLGRRPLEVTIFQSADLSELSYPARAEFIYGEWLRDAFLSGAIAQSQSSPEFTLILAQARREAIPMNGAGLADHVAEIPTDMIRRAIGDLLPELIASVDGDERNVLLTLARMWTTLITVDFVSKDAAADWCASKLSKRSAVILSLARNAYNGIEDDKLHLYPKEVSHAVEELKGYITAALPVPYSV